MAKVKIQGHASGTGILTVTAPNTSTDRTITLPDATGTLLNSDGSGASLTSLPADSTKLPLAGGALTGNVTLTTADTPSLKLEETGGSYIELTAGGSTGYIYSKSGHDLTFRPGSDFSGATQLVLTSGGRGVSQFTAKGWCKFNGETTTAILDSHNVSSVTDNGTGSTNVNWDVDMANAHYASGASSAKPAGAASAANSNHANIAEATAALVLFETNRGDGYTKKDLPECGVIAFGD
jgi:hypothetical protein